MSSQLVAVVIPVYKTDFTPFEKISLRQCLKVLGGYPLIVIKPEGLDLSALQHEHPQLEFRAFEDSYFDGIDGYNKLLTSVSFYRAFESYEYILIHQLDAFVFQDQLADWCRRGFDYVGAPQVRLTDEVPPRIRANTTPGEWRRVLLNGGLSLRRVRACIRVLKAFNRFYGEWQGNEDMLFSMNSVRLVLISFLIRLPTWREALPFAFEFHPAECFELTHHQLPLGVHAWERYDLEFWRPFIERAGHVFDLQT
jgi:hypothetical protein